LFLQDERGKGQPRGAPLGQGHLRGLRVRSLRRHPLQEVRRRLQARLPREALHCARLHIQRRAGMHEIYILYMGSIYICRFYHLRLCLYKHMYTYIHIYWYAYTYVCVCIYIHIYIYIYIYIYTYTCVHIYTHLSIYLPLPIYLSIHISGSQVRLPREALHRARLSIQRRAGMPYLYILYMGSFYIYLVYHIRLCLYKHMYAYMHTY